MSLPVRTSVKVLLLNDKNELLLLCADDPKTTAVDGKYNGPFWFLVGGQIEDGESIQEAAFREIQEEVGLEKKDIELGPVVWLGEYDLILNGTLTHLKQTFLVARTNKREVFFNNLTNWEKTTLKKIEWFSLDKIKNSKEIIYPVLLAKYLPDILAGKYPEKPFDIDLGKKFVKY